MKYNVILTETYDNVLIQKDIFERERFISSHKRWSKREKIKQEKDRLEKERVEKEMKEISADGD
ncbi:MAG: hypothetical protein P4L61_04535 [Candidatus Pacebacteria bacterium]|nr:hypothetical protein [Candidatus Paceibacterota bacterium]